MIVNDQRPNFLFIITDQHRRDHLACYGHPVLRTPHIDSLARNGVKFDRFYVTTPVCMPNRAALMTGRMPSVNGVRHNGIPLSRSAVTFVELLRASGYRTALIGKSHLQTQTGRPPRTQDEGDMPGYAPPPPELAQARKDQYSDGSYDEELPSKWTDSHAGVATPFYGFDHVELHKMDGYKPGGNYRQWLFERHPDPDSLFGPENQLPGNTYSVPQSWRTAVPEALHASTYVADRVDACLERIAGDSSRQPFFLQASFLEPHHPFTPPGRFWDMYKPMDMPRPAAFEQNNWTPPPHVSALLHAFDRGAPITDHIMAHGVGEQAALEARALTCGSISLIDACVGRMLASLERFGLKENTIVIFTSDHGEHLGDHRLLLKGLAHYDELLRVPFIWSEPQGRKNVSTSALAQTMDISATILEKAGLLPFYGMQGNSFVTVLDGVTEQHRKSILVEDENQRFVEGLGNKPRERTVVADGYRLSIFLGMEWGELYDIDNDPGEFVNLWDIQELSGKKSELLELLGQLMMSACDRSPAPLHQA